MFKNAQTRSLVRSALKIVGALTAAYFGADEVTVNAVVDNVATIGGAVTALYGIYLSFKDKVKV